jgi:hypothetical protein
VNHSAGRDRVPNEVLRYLLPHERRVITVRRHPAVLLGSLGFLTSSAIGAALLTATRRRDVTAVRSAWGLSGLALAISAFRVYAWLSRYIVVTDIRLLEVGGFPAIKVTAVPVREIHGIELRRSLIGRLLGYGTFVINTSGADKKIRFLPYPEQLYLEVWGMLTPARDEEQ